jgi:hypothetical protein
MENQNQGVPNNSNVNQQFSQQITQQTLPNSTAVLVLGIISIVGCFCYGVIGLILGIIAIVLSSKAITLYKINIGTYTEQSYNNMKAGRICAIIGLSLSAAYLIFIIIALAFYGALFSAILGGGSLLNHY